MFAKRTFASAAVQHSRIPQEKNYYKILNLEVHATPEQIKEAYRAMVKLHHPDVQGSEQPDAAKFRDVMEAFSVLSVRESRVNYDLSMRKNPNAYKEVSEAEFIKTKRNDLRDAAGNTPTTQHQAGSYAAERLAELKQQREKYNANHLGYYRGGLPQPGRGTMRGSALAPPGEFHQPSVHNFLNNYHQESNVVTSEDTVKFKNYMNSDKYDFQRSMPTHPMYYDREMLFRKDRSFWLSLLLLMIGGMYLKNKLKMEKKRWQRWDRMENLENMPAHHFHNRGGVLIKKQFVGFEKYHRNYNEMMHWFAKSNPNAFPKPTA